ncbi:NADH dehydrogenase [ubiquinone] 1 alpha subcomplex subunit 1-like [Lasioglossum baleicum]|uniref:NADH dehydrogenase [ubiquinone] 1 alpha subcomplex subunit 1-like n=1 Tax=Lasioglossum baleicum TaxID=434251 RepID=UPI003FCE378E
MWWLEILPSVAIIGVALSVPQQAAYYISKWQFGNPMRRYMETEWDINMNERDGNINGASWIRSGLETIPDK